MKQHKDFFIRYSVEKARNTIKEARFNLDNGFLNVAIARTHYSMFYAVTAPAYLENFKTAKHYQLMGWFNKEFIHERKIFSNEFFKLYKKCYENRKRADYEISYQPVQENIEDNFSKAIEFINEVEKYIIKSSK